MIMSSFARKVTTTEVGIIHLQRIDNGIVLCIVAMTVAALVEVRIKMVATNAHGSIGFDIPIANLILLDCNGCILVLAGLFILAILLKFYLFTVY